MLISPGPLAAAVTGLCPDLHHCSAHNRGRRGTIPVAGCNDCQIMATLSGCRSPYLVVLAAVTALRARLLPNAARCAADQCGKTNRGVRFRRPIVVVRAQRTALSFRS